MKKYFLLMLIASGGCSIALAQKINENNVPSTVKSSFSKHFPDLKVVQWEKEKGNYEAGFKKDGKTMSATFQTDGALIESETDIQLSELPTAVLDYVKSNYKNQKIKEAAKIASAVGVVTYEAEVTGTDLIFDSSGKLLKEVKD